MPVSLTTSGVAYHQPFDSMSNSTTPSSTMPNGWTFSESGTNANTTYAVGTGSDTGGNTYSFGATGSTDRAFGQVRSSSLISTLGASFTNDTGATIVSLLISYVGELWRLGATGRTDRMDFQISTDATSLTTGTWTDVNALDFTTPNTTGTAGLRDGNLAANQSNLSTTISGLNIAPGATFWIRWTDTDATGADDGLAIDEFFLTPTTGVAAQPGTLSIADASVTEGNSGTVAIDFVVTRSGGDDGAVSATWTATFGGGANDADAGDFAGGQLFTGTVSFADGETSKTVSLLVQGDLAIEPTEAFTVTLSAPSGGAALGDAIAAGTITNDDFPAVPVASIGDAAIVEGDSGVSYLVFTVTLTSGATGPSTINYTTSNGTAVAGSDYVGMSGQISFTTGQTSQTISVPIIGDTRAEDLETFTVTLSSPSGVDINDGSATGTITDNDGAQYFSLASGNFLETWTDTSRIAANDDWSGVDYIIGYRGDGLTAADSVPPWTVTGTSSVVDVNANQTDPNTFSTGGVTEFHLADPTIALTGSSTADAPYIVIHLDSSGRQNIMVSYRLRDIESTDNTAQPVALQYRVGTTGDWIDVPAARIVDATGTGATMETLVSAVLPADANNQPQLQVRIITTNSASNDEWVGVDDIAVTSDPGSPSLSIADTAAFEGTGGTTPIVFTVTRAGDPAGAVSATYTVSFGTGGFSADASDLVPPLTGTVEFADGETSKTITLNIVADSDPEADENFTVTLSAPVGATIGDGVATGTIVNDDGAPPLVTISDVTQAEGNGGPGATVFSFTVTRTGGTGAFTVNYATSPGTATAPEDYVHNSGMLSFAAGEMSKTIQVQVNGDTNGEPAETFSVLLSNPTGFAVIADTTGVGTIQNDDMLFIHQIQGTAYYSPILATEGMTAFNVASTTTVIVQAVVTAIDAEGNRQGFYITEETGHWDANSLTSEGIFVMTRNDAGVGTAMSAYSPTMQVGDIVTIIAQVMEYQAFSSMPRTMLVNPLAPVINSGGNPLPVLLLDAGRPIPNSIMTLVTPDYTDSADDAGDTFDASLYALSFWETVEGMLVTIPDMVVADGFVSTVGGQPVFQAYSRVHADADQINSRGGYTIAGDPPLSPPDTADTEDGTIFGGRHLHDGDVNPDIIEIDFSDFAIDAPAGLTQSLSMGDRLGDITGIVDFDFTDRKLFVTSINSGSFVNTQPARETTAFGSDDRSLTVATFNVENLDALDPQSRFDAIAQAIATNLNSPDILIIEEIQDNNGANASGGADASLTWQKLVDALNAAVPGANYQWVDQEPVAGAEGGQSGGNIRVGFLYDTNRVQLGDLAADATIAERRQFTDRIGDGVRDAGDRILFSDDMIAGEINPSDWTGTRLSLLAQFTFNGNTVFLTGNHFPAKSGVNSTFWQLNQTLETGNPINGDWAQRNAVALDVYAMMAHIENNAPTAGVLSGGDFNDFYFYRPLEVLTGYVLPDGSARVGGPRFDNLTITELTEAERYSYTFDGRSQTLDHIVANAQMSGIASYDIVHINTGYNGLGTGADIDQSISDHDPAVASFDFRSRAERLNGTAGNDTIDGGGGNDDIRTGNGNDVLIGGSGADRMEGGSGDDHYWVDHKDDMVVEAPGGGKDVVHATVSYRLAVGTEVEVLVAEPRSGTTPINLTGNEFNQSIYGNAGANILDGGGGADVMFGYGGNDFYFVDNAGDIAIEAAGEGHDVVHTTVDHRLAAGSHIEVLAAHPRSGTAALHLGGNELANAIYGNAGDNRIDGGGGADVMFGLSGNDIYFVDNAGDIAVEAANEGEDTVYTSVDHRLGANIETLIARFPDSMAALALAGNGQDNAIYGSAGNNRIDGGAGADLMVGFAGDDSYFVDNAGDMVVERAGQGHDVVLAAVDYTLASDTRVEVLAARFQSSNAAIDLTGNQLGQAIYGSVGANVLNGKGGVDVLYGFAGADRFLFDTSPHGGNFDYIGDFEEGVDKIVLDNTVYTALPDGPLSPDAFRVGTTALDADDRIIYNPLSGEIYYDADGSGSGEAVLFAKVQPTDLLTANDFLVI